MSPAIFLASRSPRRQALLKQLGLAFETLAIEVDETWNGREMARHYVQPLAYEKARTGCQKLAPSDRGCVFGADTAVVLDDVILGKPANRDEALVMLERLSGRCHHVYTAVAMVVLPQRQEHLRLSVSRVHCRPLSPAERLAYWESEEPLGKAGAYAIQGLAAAFIERIEGSCSGIMGLPLYETAELLALAGIQVLGGGLG